MSSFYSLYNYCRFDVVDMVKNSGRPDRIIEPLLLRVQCQNKQDIFQENDQRLLTKIFGGIFIQRVWKVCNDS